jgi:hypothetical protein
VRAFLKQFEPELRSLLAEAIQLQLSPSSVDAKKMQEWSERALPVFNAARTSILDGNKEWGEILDEVQRQIHKRDLDQMDVNFRMMEGKFTRWSKGDFKPEDLYATPPPSPKLGPLAGSGRSRGQVSRTAVRSNEEDFWEQEVRRLIALYKFSAEQENSAKAILKDCRDKALKYRQTNREKLDEARRKMDSASADPAKRAEFDALQKEWRELIRPIQVDLYNDLTQRVKALANDQQRAAVESAQKQQQARNEEANRQAWTEKAAEMKSADRPASSQPAAKPDEAEKPKQ